jgi:hypothetical protein
MITFLIQCLICLLLYGFLGALAVMFSLMVFNKIYKMIVGEE